MSKKKENLSELTEAQLLEKLKFSKKELFNLRFQYALNELSNTARFSQVRKEVARIKTRLNQIKNKEA